MEYSRSEWDLVLWPRSWHKRLNTAILTLIPGFIWVGLFDVMVASNSILNDYIIKSSTGLIPKIVLFIIISVIIGILDVFSFAWPIADFCRYIAKRTDKFIVSRFNIIFMKSYAYSHLPFLPLLLLASPAGLKMEDIGPDTSFFLKALMFILLILLYTQFYWQLGIMLRTISVKSKIKLSGKLIISVAIIIWQYFQSQAIYYLINVSYRLFNVIFGS